MKPGSVEARNHRQVQGAPIKDGVMAIADESYFDWPLLPEARVPSMLRLRGTRPSYLGSSRRRPDRNRRERRNDSKDAAPWEKVAQLGATASDYTDASYRSGMRSSYRVRAVNSGGTSAYSNIVRLPGAAINTVVR